MASVLGNALGSTTTASSGTSITSYAPYPSPGTGAGGVAAASRGGARLWSIHWVGTVPATATCANFTINGIAAAVSPIVGVAVTAGGIGSAHITFPDGMNTYTSTTAGNFATVVLTFSVGVNGTALTIAARNDLTTTWSFDPVGTNN